MNNIHAMNDYELWKTYLEVEQSLNTLYGEVCKRNLLHKPVVQWTGQQNAGRADQARPAPQKETSDDLVTSS